MCNYVTLIMMFLKNTALLSLIHEGYIIYIYSYIDI